MFIGCSSLLILPDISKWNIRDENKISGIFSLSSDNSYPKLNDINSNKISSSSNEIKDNVLYFEDNNFYNSENNYKNLNDFEEKKDNDDLYDYYEDFYN